MLIPARPKIHKPLPDNRNPKWSNLPRSNCDQLYKPGRPLRPQSANYAGDKYGFCSPACKKSFHKNGGAYQKLKGEVVKMVERKAIDIPEERCREIVREYLRAFGFAFDENGEPLPRAMSATPRK